MATGGVCVHVVIVCCAFVVSWSLWPFVAVCVRGRRCLWSLFVIVAVRSVGGVSVVVCLDGGGKEKSNHVTLPNKHGLLSVTNK